MDLDIKQVVYEEQKIKSLNINDDLVEAKYAYHVTCFEASQSPPKIDHLKWGIANDPTYDGVLVGLPCVFFTTTLYKGELPTISPYPTQGRPGQSYWRVKVPMRYFDTYGIFRCRNIASPQERLVMTRHGEESLLQGIGIARLDKTNNKFLRLTNGKWYTNYWWLKKNYFVNFAILHDFPLEFCSEACSRGCKKHCQWDTVKRGYQGPGQPLNREEITKRLQEQWSTYRKQ